MPLKRQHLQKDHHDRSRQSQVPQWMIVSQDTMKNVQQGTAFSPMSNFMLSTDSSPNRTCCDSKDSVVRDGLYFSSAVHYLTRLLPVFVTHISSEPSKTNLLFLPCLYNLSLKHIVLWKRPSLLNTVWYTHMHLYFSLVCNVNMSLAHETI